MKRKVDKLDVDKLLPVSVDLSKLSDVVKNDVVKKDVYNAKIKTIEDKIPDITNLATNTTLNAKINEVKKEIPSITNLATTTALNANILMLTYLTDVGNEIPNISNLIKKLKTNSNWQQNCYWSRSWCIYYDWTIIIRKLTSENFTTRLIQANLASKSDIANFVKKTDFDNKLKDVTPNLNELNELSKKVKAI